MNSYQNLSLVILIVISTTIQTYGFQLSTTSKIKGVKPNVLHDFLATPTNWPKIVLSSNSVKESNTKSNRVDIPLKVGDEVEEVFGLPPLLPLSVVWTCVESSQLGSSSSSSLSSSRNNDEGKGTLEFYSSKGVPNLAKECRMKFSIDSIDGEVDCSIVKMDMEFDLISPLLLIGATPLLKLDNDIALKILLPNVIRKS